MPIEIGSDRILTVHVGDDQIDTIQVGSDVVYRNETTQTFNVTTSGFSLASGSSTQSGVPGSSLQTTTYRRLAGSGRRWSGATSVTGTFPDGISVSSRIVGTGANNYVEVIISGTFPTSENTVNIGVNLPSTQTQRTFSYTFTGNLGRSTSCTTFGSSCTVASSSSSQTVVGQRYRNNASGTGGRGANGTTQSCAVSISSSGGSSSCNTSGGTSSTPGATIFFASNRAGYAQYAGYFSNSVGAGDSDAIAVFRFSISNYPGGTQQYYRSRSFLVVPPGGSFNASTHTENTSWNPCGDAVRVRTNLGLSRTNNRYSGAETQWNNWRDGRGSSWSASLCSTSGNNASTTSI